MRQNLHHSGSNFPSFVAKNKTCTCSSLPLGFLSGFHREPLAPRIPPSLLPLSGHGDHNLGTWVGLLLLPLPKNRVHRASTRSASAFCSSRQPGRWAGALHAWGRQLPLQIVLQLKRDKPL